MSFKKILLLFLLISYVTSYFIPSFLYIKIDFEEIPPITLLLLRVAIGGLLLYFLLRLKGLKLLPWKHLWKHFLVMGMCACSIPFFLISYGEQYISSGLAGIISGSAPLFTVIFAHYAIPNEQITWKRMFGVVLGISGLGFVFMPNLMGEETTHIIGVILFIIASIFYAIGMVYSKKHLQDLPELVGLTWQLIIATIFLIPIALILERPYSLPSPSLKAISGVFWLSLTETGLAFILYYRLTRIGGEGYLSICALLFPLIAVLFGAVFLHESLGWNGYLGGFLMIAGLGLSMELMIQKEPEKALFGASSRISSS